MGQIDFQTTLNLLREARAGDRKALEDLFARYLPKVRRIVALRLGYAIRDFAEYEDLVQDALLRVFEKLESFEERSEGSFFHWVATCVQTAVHLHFKKEAAQKRGGGKVKAFGELGRGDDSLSASIFAGKGPGPATRVSAKDLEEKVETALLGMKSHHREAIVLRHLCGMSAEEIAGAMGFSNAATARKVVQRALEELRERLGVDAPAEE